MKTINLIKHSILLLSVFAAFGVFLFSIIGIDLNAETKNTNEENPLLGTFTPPFNVPAYDKLKTQHFEPAFNEAMLRQKKTIEAIVNNPDPATFVNTIEALDDSGAFLYEISAIFDHLKSCQASESLEKLSAQISPIIARHRDDIKLNDKLFQRIKTVYQAIDKSNLTEEQRTLTEKIYKDYAREGANLPPEKKTRLKEINGELTLLSQKFGSNLLKETNNFKLIIDKKEDLEGLPQSLIDSAAQAAKERGHEGKWVFTLQRPSIFPFLQNSKKRELREKLFKGYINRGNNGNEYDNNTIIVKIVALRLEKAKLLGYKTFADLVLEPNMAKTPEKVYQLLRKLWVPSVKMAQKEAADLQASIDKEGGKFKLEPWDWWYYTEKLKKERFDLNDESIRPYFQLENVKKAAFYVANKLFGLVFEERKDIPKFNPLSEAYEVKEADGRHVGIIIMDFFPRESKRGGAWMNELRLEAQRHGRRIPPIVTNNHNFPKPTENQPTLLNFDEVETLFHEFGHGLHGLLSNCTYYTVSGSSVALDFVELPSQILESWAMQPEVLKVYAKHYKTGEIIPQQLIDNMKNSKNFNNGFVSTEFLASALFDMDLHTLEDVSTLDVQKFEAQSMEKIGLIHQIVPRYKATYFNHIFNSQYEAGYYSYRWAAVLDADAFQAFKETHLFDQKTAQSFRRNILEKGGSAEPMVLYKRFRGAEPRIEPLLIREGFLIDDSEKKN